MKKEDIKTVIKDLMENENMKSMQSFSEFIKKVTKVFIEEASNQELKEHLNYEKHDQSSRLKNKDDNYRNGVSKRMLKTEFGDMVLDIPRDSNGTFYPSMIQKYKRVIPNLEDQILAMYMKGLSTRNISYLLNEQYGFTLNKDAISEVTDKLNAIIKEWQNRPLDKYYPIIFIDGFRTRVKESNGFIDKSVYIIMGINNQGYKEVLSFWISESESAQYWLNILNELKSRGVEEINIVCCDNLSGVSNAIKSAYPNTMIQKCVVHQIRNSCKYISSKDLQNFVSDLKKIYKAPTIEMAKVAMLNLETKWSGKYKKSVDSWINNWDELTTFYKLPLAIRKTIYTTNVIENLNRNIRKFTKSKSSGFINTNSLEKSVYAAIMDSSSRWTKKEWNWPSILQELDILFEREV